MGKREVAERIYERIRSDNLKDGEGAVPASDSFLKEVSATEGLNPGEILESISLLKESHRIFVITISRENRTSGIKEVNGYVVSEREVLAGLRSLYQKRLMDAWEKEKKRKLHYGLIIKELLASMDLYVNTPLGKIANITIMLNEYEKLLENNWQEYSDQWKEQKFAGLISDSNVFAGNEPAPSGEAEDREEDTRTRAVDTDRYESFEHEERKLSPARVLEIYGADFLFRVKLRKYDFEYLMLLLSGGHINRKAELTKLRNMLRTIKNNFDRDEKLNDHFEEIFRLDREVSRRLFFFSR